TIVGSLFRNYWFNIPHMWPYSFAILKNLLTYEEGITNAMIYPYSNGKIEAKNTHIKTMKRVSYGFKSFENMRIRIFLINQLINVR
ncbi:transposase, partial [Enterococcus casseliflavus]|uniref:transposase n=1 Tax=Enterococcus casseliflavus TaxID=37734 RepID=UPI00403C3D3B